MLMNGTLVDSAYLPASAPGPYDGSGLSSGYGFGFNYNSVGSQYISFPATPGQAIWKTGPYPETSYETRFSITSQSGGVSLAGPSGWQTLGSGSADTPYWTLGMDIGTSTCVGTLEIRNWSVPGVILASVVLSLLTDPNI